MKKAHFADCAILTLLVLLLIGPWFKIEYLDNWPSIESTFISDGRMLAENLPHPGWQPNWYAGGRFDYIYPPALRYGTALISKFGGVSTARAYHLYTGTFYLFGILSVYWLLMVGSRSRLASIAGAALTALISPSVYLIERIRIDSGGLPIRLHVLATYGEGPHVSALCVIPGALAALWLGIRSGRWRWIVVAGALSALAVSNNFYGATALALLAPGMVVAGWAANRDWRVLGRAVATGALAYGLCAWWLTPSFLRITLTNLRLVAEPGNQRSAVIFALTLLAIYAAAWFWANRRPERAWSAFCLTAAGTLLLYVVGHERFGLQVFGVPLRLVPELDLALLLALAMIGAFLFDKGIRAGAIVLLLLPLTTSTGYLRQPWLRFPEAKTFRGVYAHEVNTWIARNLPGDRVYSTGEVRFWLNAWTNTSQPEGGSQQGMQNQVLPVAIWQLLTGDQQEASVLWLQALGTDAAVVADKQSRDFYRGDIKFPEKFKGLPVLHDDGHGTLIYRIPRQYKGIGRIVDPHVIESIGPITEGLDLYRLRRYTAETEKPGRNTVEVKWADFDHVSVRATTGTDEGVLLQQTWDEFWVAEEAGKRLEVRRDPAMGFLMIPLAPGKHTVNLRFTTPTENRIGQVLTVLSGLLACIIFYKSR